MQPSFTVKYKVAELLNITEETTFSKSLEEKNDFLIRLQKFLPKVSNNRLFEIFTSQFLPCIENFKNPNKVTFFIEEKSVDPYYKNTFANFFVFKSDDIGRYTMKIAFFMDENDSIIPNSFFGERNENLQKNCIGFLTLKPILSNIINRAVINPIFIKGIEDSFYIRTCTIPFSINGVTLQAEGFPFFSQNQYARCADVSILSLTSYYSHRYSNHKDLYPSEIQTILKNKRSTSSAPSNGETVANMNRVLQKIGFSTKVLQYKKSNDGSGGDNQEMLMKSVAFFIESGIPCILTLKGDFPVKGEKEKQEDFLHTILCIGRVKQWQWNESSFYNSWKDNEYIFLDDKIPFLSKGKLHEIAEIYKPRIFEHLEVKIDHVIIPMHRSIWLQPELIERGVDGILKSLYPQNNNQRIKYKYMLSSARNIREFSNKYFPKIVSQALLQLTFRSKFLVLIEIVDEKMAVIGFILVDTTSEHFEDGTILAVVNDVLFTKDEDSNEFTRFYNNEGDETTIPTSFCVSKQFLNFLE